MGILNCNSYNSTYAEVKRLTETLCSIYINQKQLPIIILRPFSFFGPYQKLDKPWAINNFIRDALNGGPIKIIGDGSVSRSYLYGSDLAFWLLKILITKNDINIYNIGSANEITLKELAELIKEVINDDIKIVERTSGFNNHVNNCSIPNIELLLKNIDLVENFTLIENLRNSINWLLINRRK
jgi:dTDP-glucose 4,6-dehydratase